MPLETNPRISISVVSHGQGALLQQLLADIVQHVSSSYEVIITLNLPEEFQTPPSGADGQIKVIRNSHPQGFGHNHNQAFAVSNGEYFCVINPDVRLVSDPFPPLIETLGDTNHRIGVCGPRVTDAQGNQEDSARVFPSVKKIVRRLLGLNNPAGDFVIADSLVLPDSIAGMFMLFRRDVYARYNGFDQRYFLYYEDTDFCARLRRDGLRTALDPRVTIIHDARRSSHRKFKYMRWHLESMLRYLLTHNALMYKISGSKYA